MSELCDGPCVIVTIVSSLVEWRVSRYASYVWPCVPGFRFCFVFFFDRQISPYSARAAETALAGIYQDHDGNVNPQVGQPDLLAIVKAFTPEWIRRVRSGDIKPLPREPV